MPKQTFFNLSDEKKDRLLQAAYQEFSSEPLETASINAIIQQSEISRGSFYQYFEDKEDLYFYCLDLLRENQTIQMTEHYRNASGDLYEGILKIFAYLYHHYLLGEHKGFYHHFFVNMTFRKSRAATVDEGKTKRPLPLTFFRTLARMSDKSKLRITSETELVELLQFLFQTMHWTISQVFMQGLEKDEACRLMEQRMRWIVKGVAITTDIKEDEHSCFD